MYKIAGIGLAAIFAMMVIPGVELSQADDSKFYGLATLAVHDMAGNEVFTQIIHNQLTNQGEDFILDAIFDDGNAGPADNVSFGSICVTDIALVTTGESATASTFDTETEAGGLGNNANCVSDTAAGVTTTSSIATVGPLTFDEDGADGANVDTGDTITYIVVCQTVAADDNDFADCETAAGGSGQLLAIVDTTDVTLNSGDTVAVTYTFNLVSATT